MQKRAITRENLPEDTEALRSIILQQEQVIEEIHKKNLAEKEAFLKEIEELKEQNARQINFRFGQRTEKIEHLQINLFDEPLFSFDGKVTPLISDDDLKDLEAEQQDIASSKKKPKRTPISTNKNIPQSESTIAPSSDKLTCKNCKKELTQFGQEESYQYEYKPASIKRHKTTRPKYACKCCGKGGVVIADMPSQPIPKSNAGAGLLADLLVSKGNDHLPLYRIQQIYNRHGVDIPRSTLSDWFMKCAVLLAPIVEYMLQDILQSHHIFTDDTVIPVQQGKGPLKKARLWVYIGDLQHRYYVFTYSPTRQGKYPQEILQDYSGYIHADAYSGYDTLFKPKIGSMAHATECACWAHTRRKFADIIKSGPKLKEAEDAVKLIAQLFKIEKDAKEFTNEARKAYRLKHSKPLLDKFEKWLNAHKNCVTHKGLKDAITYACNQWAALNTYLEDGRLCMENNISERTIRPVTTGRKNWMFAGNDKAGENMAVIQSLIATCKAHKINPYSYLNDALLIMAEARDYNTTEKAKEFTPLAWKEINQKG